MTNKPITKITLFILFALTGLNAYISSRLLILNCKTVVQYIPSYACVSSNAIGNDSYSSVFLIKDKRGKKFTARVFDLKDSEKYARTDLETVQKLQGHRNIIKFVEHVEQDGLLIEVLEFASEGSSAKYFFDGLGFAPDQYALLNFFLGVAKGIYHIHSNGLVHSDIRLENVVLNERGVPKIIGFELATLEGSSRGLQGEPSHMPPEIYVPAMQELEQLQKKMTAQAAAKEVKSRPRIYTAKGDVYALGLALFQTISRNQLPFCLKGDTEKTCLERTKIGTYTVPKGTRKDIAIILESCLAADPAKRGNIEHIITLIANALQNTDSKKINRDYLLSNFVADGVFNSISEAERDQLTEPASFEQDDDEEDLMNIRYLQAAAMLAAMFVVLGALFYYFRQKITIFFERPLLTAPQTNDANDGSNANAQLNINVA